MAATEFPEIPLRIETDRFGPFTFLIGVTAAEVRLLVQRVDDAHERFVASPLAQVANQLEHEVAVSSVFGTNSIEGGTLSEEETAVALNLDPAQVTEVEQRRAVNIKAAYDRARAAAAAPAWSLDVNFIVEIHAAITKDIPHPKNQPGLLRDNPKSQITYVSNDTHGGRYKPPQHGEDIRKLLDGLVDWQKMLANAGLPALIRAPLMHLYYELIHPFWDGNGRVGRVIEATLLQAGGYRYAPFAVARYYLENIDTYFTLFNTCRKAAQSGHPSPNVSFVAFHLDGMRLVINRLHDRVNRMVDVLLFDAAVRDHLERKQINLRQYAILKQIMEADGAVPLDALRTSPWYKALYVKRTDKTKQRDIRRLREHKLLHLDGRGRLRPGFAKIPEHEE